jgi:hypothetical protein
MWIGTDSSRHINELNDIEPPLSTLILRNEGLRPAELPSDLFLSEASLLARSNE